MKEVGMKRDEQIVEELLEKLGEICEELGWSVAILGGANEDTVDGMIIGTDEFVQAAIESEDYTSVNAGKKSTVTH